MELSNTVIFVLSTEKTVHPVKQKHYKEKQDCTKTVSKITIRIFVLQIKSKIIKTKDTFRNFYKKQNKMF